MWAEVNGIKRDITMGKKEFDIDMMLEQLEIYGKYEGILYSEGDKCENYIPVSIAKRIVKARGLGGIFGYTKDDIKG